MTTGPGIEPGRHWWEASAFTTAPSLLVAQVLSESMMDKNGITRTGLTPGPVTLFCTVKVNDINKGQI